MVLTQEFGSLHGVAMVDRVKTELRLDESKDSKSMRMKKTHIIQSSKCLVLSTTNDLEMNKLYDLNKLDYLLETVERKIQYYGVRFKNNLYINKNLRKYTGKVATLRYNPFDLTTLKVYLKDRFLFSVYLKDKE